MTEDKQQK